MRVLKEIATWASQQPLWQQHALRKLVDKSKLDRSDIAALVAVCKAEHGLGDPASLVAPEQLEAMEGTGASSADHSPVLRDVKQLHNVNALREDQALSISPAGLTVVYGDNGTGKTGYVRVIKQLCRARGARDVVHPNVYKEVADPVSATLAYDLAGESKEVNWTPTTQGPPELSNISVFDSRSASVYVTEDNDVAYLPQGMDLFPRLVRVVEDVKGSLENELGRLSAEADRFETIPPGTRVSEVLTAIHLPQGPKQLEQLMALTDEELRELERLRAEVSRNRADDPLSRARELNLRAARLQGVLDRYRAACQGLSAEAIAELRSSRRVLVRSREAAVVASQGAFSDVPIQGIGSETWRALWEAARRFSTTDARPKQAFPPSGSDAVCVLCQQPLPADIQTRMGNFEEFVRSETRAAVSRAEGAVRRASLSIETADALGIADTAVLKEIEALDPSLASMLRESVEVMTKRRESALKAESEEDWQAVPAHKDVVSDPLKELTTHTISQAQVFEAAADSGSIRATEDALRELEARVELGRRKERVFRQIEREDIAKKLRKCIRSANTASITKYNTELLNEAVTQPLGDEFLHEVQALNLNHLPLAVEASRGEKGRAYHKLALESKRPSSVPMVEVLSEGEHRCTALAAFFAEVSLQEARSTLVFDDPVSSMDHGRIQYVARRIVEIASSRPVLVFTHDLVFLWMLQGAAEKANVPLHPRYFRRDASGAGLVTEEFPWTGQKIAARINDLRQDLARLTRVSASDRPAYERGLRDFYGRLRDCWERAVEEVLFNGAVRRFSPEVQSLRLKNLHRVTEQQMQDFEAGMTKASRWQHDQPPGLSLAAPEPDELRKDLESFETWVRTIKKQHDS